MIDIHNHLLPGIDDGPKTLEDALAMARMAADDGITHMVCTPHIHPGRYDNTIWIIQQSLQQFRNALMQADIPLQVSAAAEVRFGIELMAEVNKGALPFLGYWQERAVLLLELPHNKVPYGTDLLLDWLLARGILPMIAHPERNRGIIQNPQQLQLFLQKGCLLQITAGAITGRFGPGSMAVAHQLLEQGKVTVVASDAHNLSTRPPVLSTCLPVLKELIGEARAMALMMRNPWKIVRRKFEKDRVH